MQTTTQTRTTHTPGPHYYAPGDRYIREEATDATIARLCEDDGHADDDARQPMPVEANGRLYAAAPDYYDAAEAIRAYVVAAERLDDGCECSIPADLVRALLDAHRRAYANP